MWRINNNLEASYRTTIQSFLDYPEHYNSFKSNQLYKTIIGEPLIFQALKYIQQLDNYAEIRERVSDIAKMDTIGKPTTFKFSVGNLSLNCVRYINTLCLLQKEFNSLNNLSILEIGTGYGGLLHAINTMWTPLSYNIIDLAEVMILTKKHSALLNHNNIQLGHINADLAIAEYSITEQDNNTLMSLTEQHVMPARNAFIRCNTQDTGCRTEWIKYLGTKFKVSMYPEEPHTVNVNRIVVCKEKGIEE